MDRTTRSRVQHKGDGAPHGRQVQLLKCLTRLSRRKRCPRVVAGFYPLVAVFRSALISFCTQISAAPVTGSVLPGIVNQPLFTSMSPR